MGEIISNVESVIEKKKILKKVCSCDDGRITYLHGENDEKWLEEYPNSEYHGGGLPQLRKIENFPWE